VEGGRGEGERVGEGRGRGGGERGEVEKGVREWKERGS
jgi:hypothetical protein